MAHEATLFMGFSRQECWIGLPFPSPGDLPEPRDQSPVYWASCTADRLPLHHWRSPLIFLKICTFPVSGVNMKTQIASHQFRSDSIAKNVWFVEGFGAGNTELKKKSATHTQILPLVPFTF